LTNQEQLASEQRRKELKHQNFSTKNRREKKKSCKGGVGRRKLTNQELLASDQRRKEVKYQNYSTKNRRQKKEDLQRLGWT
jgi:hypothetical protein